MATNRTVDELLQMFREGLPPKAITPVYFQDMIQSLHPSTGLFTGLPATPANVQPGFLWLNGDVLQMSLGGGPGTRLGNYRGAGNAALAVTTPRQRMLARTQYLGRGTFGANATVFTPSPPSQGTTFSDNFNSHDANKWAYDSFDEGGDAFWSDDPSLTPQIFTFTGGRLNLNIIDAPSGGKSLTSGMTDTFNAPNNFSQYQGYVEIAIAVDRYPGLFYEIAWITPPPFAWSAICPVRIWTDDANVQMVQQFAYDASIDVSYDSNGGWDASVQHSYGLEWTPSAVRIYRDRQQVGNFGNPGGPYSDGVSRYLKMYCQTNFGPSTTTVNPAGLPKGAHIDSINMWSTRPF